MTKPPTRHERRRADTHQRLIDAARELIGTRGYGAVDIIDITERADVSKATFYKHFRNKEDCVRELMQQGFDALVAEIMAMPRAQHLTSEWIHESFERVFKWADENRSLMTVMVGGAASMELDAFGRQYMARIVEQTINRDFTADILSNPFPPRVVAHIVTGIVVQLVDWWLSGETPYSAADMATFVHTTLLHGLISLEQGPITSPEG